MSSGAGEWRGSGAVCKQYDFGGLEFGGLTEDFFSSKFSHHLLNQLM